MKWAWLGILGLVSSAFAQQQSPAVNLFQTVRPQLLLTIRRDPNGSRADLLEVKSVEPGFPEDLLRNQILELGRQMNCDPRGLSVGRYSLTGDASMTSIKASCAIDNIIDRDRASFHLTQIARSFAGAPKPNEVVGLTVLLIGETPRLETLLAFGNPGDPVQVQGVKDSAFKGIEYRIKLNSQIPSEINIPESGEQNSVPGPSTVASSRIDWLLWALIGIAAIAFGALVYSLLINRAISKPPAGKT